MSVADARQKVLCVARIDRQKNQMMLVEALARRPGMTLRLVGPVTQRDYEAELRTRARELGVAPGSRELAAEYLGADVFVLPSRHEPFGIVVLEAWAAGLPVVASDVGGLGRLCAAHPEAARLFAPGDADAMDRALDEVASASPEGRRAMSDAGRKAAGEYDWGVLSARLVGFYSAI